MRTHKNTQMLTSDQVAEMFGVEEATVRSWAKKGALKARKIGRNWFFNKSYIFEKQSVEDAIGLVGGELGFSNSYDLLVDNERIEIKSSLLKIGKNGEYWTFTNFHPSTMSDFYLLLGYDLERSKLLYAIKISSVELEKRMPVIMTKGKVHKLEPLNEFDGCSFNVYLKDEYFHSHVIFKDFTLEKENE